jgi:hypothetical protein
MYLLAFLDRSVHFFIPWAEPVAECSTSVNIANANVFGLSKELKMEGGNKYNTALVIFFVPYILFEIPSNILLKRLKPRVWLSLCMFGFGLGKLPKTRILRWGLCLNHCPSHNASRVRAKLLRASRYTLLFGRI